MHLFNLIYLWSRLDSSATKRSQWTYWTVRLLKFGVHKLPLSKTANLGMRNKISSKNLVVLYAHAEGNWPQFSWSHRQKGNYGQTAIGSFFKTFFFCTEALYNVEYWNKRTSKNYSSFHAKQQATRCELELAVARSTIDLGQFLIMLHFQ